MNTLKNIARNLFRILRWIWTLISYIPTFFIRTLTVLIIILIIFNYFSKFTTNIKGGTALLIQMDGILVEQAKSKSSFDFFIQNNDPKEIEINKIVKAINLAGDDKNIESIVIDLSNFIGGYPGDIIYISETLLKFKKNTNKSIKKGAIDKYLLKTIKFKKFSTIKIIEKNIKLVSKYSRFILTLE